MTDVVYLMEGVLMNINRRNGRFFQTLLDNFVDFSDSLNQYNLSLYGCEEDES